jgi:hypothetical protein
MSVEKSVIGLGGLMLVLWLFVAGCWIGNAIELVGCKWNHPDGNWKNEIVHGLGLIAPLSVVTVWFPNNME